LWMIIIPLFGGYLLSLWKPGLVARLPVAGLTNLSMILLLMVMGARLGADPQVVGQIGSLGVQAFAMAVATVLGSTLLLYLVQFLLPRRGGFAMGEVEEVGGASGHGLTLMLVAAVLAGIALGLFLLPQSLLPHLNAATTWILGLLLLAVGLDLGGSSRAFAQLKNCGWRIILVPLGVVLGSILGGLALALFWPGASWNEMAAVASGFGWYSLSSVLIAEVSPVLGAVAFLANVFRELIAIVITPLVSRWLGPVPSLGAAGATAMDVLLPVIAKGTGREYVPLSFFSGAVLSLSVPLFVNLFLYI
jgi:uncharacterized membrane protein YbjE (DUF340 family)